MDFVDLKNHAFACRIGNNAEHGEHCAGYNGVWSLVPAGHDESIFVPAYAGLNLEHYFDAWHKGGEDVFFEPRKAPMELELVDASTVRLTQQATPFWGVESSTTFSVREPNIIDMSFSCTPRRNIFHNATMGVFWASYIQQPEDKAINFRGRNAEVSSGWVRFESKSHGNESSVRGTSDDVDLEVSAAMRRPLFSSVTPIRWERPYYYGRWRDKVYIVMFKSLELLRFAMSPSGGDNGNPAWDFMFLVSGSTHRSLVHIG